MYSSGATDGGSDFDEMPLINFKNTVRKQRISQEFQIKLQSNLFKSTVVEGERRNKKYNLISN